jgi:hypothetical protein
VKHGLADDHGSGLSEQADAGSVCCGNPVQKECRAGRCHLPSNINDVFDGDGYSVQGPTIYAESQFVVGLLRRKY